MTKVLALPRPVRLVGMALLVALVALSTTAQGAVASATEPFNAYGVLLGIDEGDVSPAGKSGRFVVKDRHVTGALIDGDIIGPLSLEYGTNVPILTQSGQIHGTLVVQTSDGPVTATIRGASAIGACSIPVPPFAPPLPPFGLVVDGTFTLTDGNQGHGNFSACVWAALDGEGHIVPPLFGVVSMSGDWKP